MASIVDADSHLFEMPEMWSEYADPGDRHHALYFDRDDNGWDWVSWKDRRILETWITRAGDFSTLGPVVERCRVGEQCDFDYRSDLPDHYWNGAARAGALSDLGADESILFPNWGLNWGLGLRDQPEARLVNEQSWNRWAVQVKADGGESLHPVGHLELEDLDWLERQLQMLAAGGIKIGWIPAGLVNGVRLSDERFDRAWAMFEHYDINPVFHVGANPNRPFADGWYTNDHSEWLSMMAIPLIGLDVFASLVDLVLGGVMERFSTLRWGVLEVMTDWFPMLLRRLDVASYTQLAATGRTTIDLAETPSHYIHRSVRVSSFATEQPGETMDAVGPLLMWSADYPHAEGEPHLDVYRNRAGHISDGDADAFWGGNAEFLLGR
jgi:hypothetical protein